MCIRDRHHTGQSCRLLGAKLRGADAVVVPRRRFGAEHAVAPFDDVEIDLENALLAPDRFDHQGDDRFLGLAPGGFRRCQKKVLGQLLGNGRAAGNDFSAPLVLFHGLLDSAPVESFMMDEEVVFRDDDGALQINRDSSITDPLFLEPVSYTHLDVYKRQVLTPEHGPVAG